MYNNNTNSQKFRDSEAKVVGTVGFQWECELYVFFILSMCR